MLAYDVHSERPLHAIVVRRDAKLASIKDLGGSAICLIGGSSNDATTADWARTRPRPRR